MTKKELRALVGLPVDEIVQELKYHFRQSELRRFRDDMMIGASLKPANASRLYLVIAEAIHKGQIAETPKEFYKMFESDTTGRAIVCANNKRKQLKTKKTR
jgi:hypothetical protein